MGPSIILDVTGGPRRHEHICWAFDHPAELRARIARFLADGLAAGQRVWYIGADDADRLAGDMATVDGFEAALASGQATVATVSDMYPAGSVVDPRAQVAAYAEATRAALADGYTGFRVGADATSLVQTAEQVEQFARYEYLADRFMSRNPMDALCGYQRLSVGVDGLAAVASMHPSGNPPDTPLRLHSSPDPQVSAVLSGHVDLTGRALFPSTLRRADLPLVDGALVVDARTLTFIDHHGLAELAALARERGTTAVLRTRAHSAVPVLAHLLGLPELQVEAG